MRCDPARLQRRQAGHAGGEDRRLRIVGPAEFVVGPVPAQPRQREPQDLISAKKDLAGLGRRRGYLLAHPSVLGTLSWKDECDRHVSCTDNVAGDTESLQSPACSQQSTMPDSYAR